MEVARILWSDQASVNPRNEFFLKRIIIRLFSAVEVLVLQSESP